MSPPPPTHTHPSGPLCCTLRHVSIIIANFLSCRCQAEGGNGSALASVQSEEEYSFVDSAVRAVAGNGEWEYFLGATRQSPGSSVFVWPDSKL